MKLMLVLFFLVSNAFAFEGHEKITITKANNFATGKFTEQKYHAWPFPLLSIGHNMHSYQDYGGSPYWHDGLDIRSNQDQPIYAAVGGQVVNIENYVAGNPIYWEIAILDEEGFVWKYHHVERKSIPQEIQNAFKTREKIKTGTLLGNAVRWPVSSFGEAYHHCHLLIVAADGKYINPFLMMAPLPDTATPVINRIGIAKNHKPTDLKEVSGSYSLFVDASDLTLHTKFILPPYKITWRVDNGDEKILWEFINLPSGKSDTDFISDFHLNGTCGDYSCRKFYFNLNFTPSTPRGQMSVDKGDHTVEVTAEDIVGNKTSKSFSWRQL